MVSLRLVLNKFPFPVSTAKILGTLIFTLLTGEARRTKQIHEFLLLALKMRGAVKAPRFAYECRVQLRIMYCAKTIDTSCSNCFTYISRTRLLIG
jgi:hypothetical protein